MNKGYGMREMRSSFSLHAGDTVSGSFADGSPQSREVPPGVTLESLVADSAWERTLSPSTRWIALCKHYLEIKEVRPHETERMAFATLNNRKPNPGFDRFSIDSENGSPDLLI